MNKRYLFFIVATISAFLLGIGLFSGENMMVFQTAISICLNCIGIG